MLQAIKDEILGKDDSNEEDEDGDDEGGESGSEEEEEQAQQNMAIEVHLPCCLCCTLSLYSNYPLAHDSCLPQHLLTTASHPILHPQPRASQQHIQGLTCYITLTLVLLAMHLTVLLHESDCIYNAAGSNPDQSD